MCFVHPGTNQTNVRRLDEIREAGTNYNRRLHPCVVSKEEGLLPLRIKPIRSVNSKESVMKNVQKLKLFFL